MLGLLKPKKGHILFNNENLEENINQWWKNVAYLPQETFILNYDYRKQYLTI